MNESLLGVIIIITIGFGLILRNRFSQKTHYIAHFIVLVDIFVFTFGYSLSTEYLVQALPWWWMTILYSTPVLASLVVGITLDTIQYFKNHHKTRQNSL